MERQTGGLPMFFIGHGPHLNRPGALALLQVARVFLLVGVDVFP